MKARILFPLLTLAALSAEPDPNRFVDIFTPLRTETAALSPDGRRLAYSLREGDKISIVALDIDHPQQATALVAVAQDKYATGYKQADWGNNPSKILWLGWASGDRLLAESNMQFLTGHPVGVGAIFGFDYNGAHARLLYSSKDAMSSIMPLEFTLGIPPEFILREKLGWTALDPVSGHARPLGDREYEDLQRAVEARHQAEAPLRKTQQAALQELFPHREITLYEHHETSDRVLALVQNIANAGSFVVYDPTAHKAWDFAARAPALTGARARDAEAFDLTDTKSEHFTGSLVLPRSPRIKRAPLVLWMPETTHGRVHSTYQPEVQAFADMGFAVAVFDHVRPEPAAVERPADGHPVRSSPSSLAEEISHQLRGIDALADHYPVSRQAVALFGQNQRATRALVAASSVPGRIRCVIAINPTIETLDDRRFMHLGALEGALAHAVNPPFESALILSFPGRGPTYGQNPDYLAARVANAELKEKHIVTEWGLLDEPFMNQQAAAHAAAFRQIEAFLTEHLYRYSVKLGETEFVETPATESPR